MKLILCIKGNYYAELEVEKIDMYKNVLSFSDRCKITELHITLLIRQLKNRYEKVMELYPWEIILQSESKINGHLDDYE